MHYTAHMKKDIEANYIVSQDFNLGLPEVLEFVIDSGYRNTEFEAYDQFWQAYRAFNIPKGWLCWRAAPTSVVELDKDKNPALYRVFCHFNILPEKELPPVKEDPVANLFRNLLTEWKT